MCCPPEVVARVLAVLTLLMAGTGVLAVGYIWHVWRADDLRPRSLLIGLLLFGAAVGEGSMLVLAPFAVRQLLGLERHPLAGPVLTLAIFAVLLVPHAYALGIWLIRRGAVDDERRTTKMSGPSPDKED